MHRRPVRASFLRPRGPLLGLLAAALVGQAAAQQPTPAPLAEQQLRAIRQALLDKAMAAQTRVSSTAWIDEKGELREASEFRTDLKVRGVRVLEYVGEGDGAQAVVTTEPAVVPSGETAGELQRQCRAEAGVQGWRHPVSLKVDLHPGQNPALVGAARQALGMLSASLQRQAELAQGSLLPSPGVLPTGGNRYEQAVYGVAHPRQGLTLSVRVRLLDEAEMQAGRKRWARTVDAVRDWARWDEPEQTPVLMWVEFSLARPGEAPVLQLQREWPLLVAQQERPVRPLTAAAASSIAGRAGLWWMAVQDALACEPLSFEARSQGDGLYLLLAGRDAGLQPGDRLVLTDSRHVPRRLLEADAAPHLALVEVTSVRGTRAEARRIAGVPGSADPSAQWVAMPYALQSVAAAPPASAARRTPPAVPGGPGVLR